jgi:hypothetical protein
MLRWMPGSRPPASRLVDADRVADTQVLGLHPEPSAISSLMNESGFVQPCAAHFDGGQLFTARGSPMAAPLLQCATGGTVS